MSTKLRVDDDIEVWIDGGDGDGPRGCQWDEMVCMDAPTHRIVPPEHNRHHDAVAVYCARHYALALARLVIVHIPGCDDPLSAHIATHGAVS